MNVIELNPSLEIVRANRATGDTGTPSVPGNHPLYPPALREMLEVNDYQVALVSRGMWNHMRGAEAEPPPVAAPSFLLAFSWQELVGQVSEFVRESKSPTEGPVTRFSDVSVNFSRMEVRRLSGELVIMTHQEFKALRCFLSNPERVFSRDELLNEAWGYENYPLSRTVDNHVLKLRQKLEPDPIHPVHFRTVHGVGYKFVP
jgi:DNA-binding winged helix-turn-helix (wHTH) protein